MSVYASVIPIIAVSDFVDSSERVVLIHYRYLLPVLLYPADLPLSGLSVLSVSRFTAVSLNSIFRGTFHVLRDKGQSDNWSESFQSGQNNDMYWVYLS